MGIVKGNSLCYNKIKKGRDPVCNIWEQNELKLPV